MTRGAELLTSLNSKFSKIRGRIIPDAPMCQITWLRVGGLADILFQPIDVEDLSEFLRAIPAEISLMVVGTGSNILVRDGGIEGIVIRLLTKEFGKNFGPEQDPPEGWSGNFMQKTGCNSIDLWS